MKQEGMHGNHSDLGVGRLNVMFFFLAGESEAESNFSKEILYTKMH